MTGKLLVSTNKARIWLGPGQTVFKEFFQVSRARGEYRSLWHLRSLFALEVSADGWRYRTVDVQGYDEPPGRIRMEYIAGQTLSEAMAGDPTLAFHLGRWLGYFHGRTGGDSGQVTLFSDVSVYNFMVDASSQTITAIDPGLDFGRRGLREVDVLMGVASLMSQAWKCRVRPRWSVLSYLSGYSETCPRRIFEKGALEEAISVVMDRFERKRRSRLDYLIFGQALAVYSRWIVPRLYGEVNRPEPA